MRDSHMPDSEQPAARIRMQQLWDGQVPLVTTFWLYYFVAVAALNILALAIGGPIGRVMLVFALLWAGFMVRPIWKAAEHYQGEPVLAVIAKVVAVLIGISVFANLVNAVMITTPPY